MWVRQSKAAVVAGRLDVFALSFACLVVMLVFLKAEYRYSCLAGSGSDVCRTVLLSQACGFTVPCAHQP